MRSRVLLATGASAILLISPEWQPPLSSSQLTSTLFGVENEICLMPPDRSAYRQTRGGGAGRELPGDKRRGAGDWPPEGVAGGDIMPVRTVFDPYPTFDAVAVDAAAGRAFFTDSSLSSLLSYSTEAGGSSDAPTEPATRVLGPDTGIGFIAGGEVDPERKEVYAVNNDGG